jgi:hypothetical protein
MDTMVTRATGVQFGEFSGITEFFWNLGIFGSFPELLELKFALHVITSICSAMNPKIVINDDVVRPLTQCETRASSATSVDILRHNSTSSKVIASAMRRSHSTFSAKVNR